MKPQTQSESGPLFSNARLLHTMIRVGNLERSIHFYTKILGMRELRRETYPEGRFTLVFVGYGEEDSHCVIELTHNWDEEHYQHGSGYGHIALAVNDITLVCKQLESMGVKILRAPAPMTFAADETDAREIIAFIEDPDGYSIELIQKA